MAYLDSLDDLLAPGAAALGGPFRRLQTDYVLAAQLPDGGFPGRQGDSDIYYTDFALRVLNLVAPGCEAMARAAPYVALSIVRPRDLIESFCALNSARILDRNRVPLTINREGAAAVAHHQAPSDSVRAYDAFIGALCCELLDIPLPHLEQSRAAVADLQGPGGGFAERPGEAAEQTNATAAAAAFLIMTGKPPPELPGRAARFLAAMQAPDGGLLAHADAPCSDLLSTFTGLLTLLRLDAPGAVDLPAAGRFVRSTADARGGFRSCPLDDAADLEYTYYGLGCLALLRAALDR